MDSLTEELVRQLHRNPRDTALLESVRSRLLEQRRYRALAALLEWWAKKAPSPQAAAQALYDAGAVLADHARDRPRAIELLAAAITRDPAHDPASIELERLLVKIGAAERAADALERQAAALAAGIYPRSARANVLARIGRLRAKHLGDLDGAIEAFRQAVNTEPNQIAVAEELIGLYLTRAHRGDRSVAEADHQRAAELYHRLAKQVGGPPSVPYLESALDLAPAYVEALEMLERITPSMKPPPDLKPRWRAFIQHAGAGTGVDQRRHMLAKAYMADEQLALAVEVMLPLAERGDDRAQRTVEQLQRRLGLSSPQFLTPEERSEIALLDILRAQDEQGEDEPWEEADTTTGVLSKNLLEDLPTGISRSGRPPAAPPDLQDTVERPPLAIADPDADPTGSMEAVKPRDHNGASANVPTRVPLSPSSEARTLGRASNRPSPLKTTQLGLGPSPSGETRVPAAAASDPSAPLENAATTARKAPVRRGPDDDLPTAKAVISDDLLDAISRSSSLLQTLSSSSSASVPSGEGTTDDEHETFLRSGRSQSDEIAPEDTIRADLPRPPSGDGGKTSSSVDDDRWDLAPQRSFAAQRHGTSSGESTVDVVSGEISSWEGGPTSPSSEAVLPLDDARAKLESDHPPIEEGDVEETTVTGRVSLKLRSKLAGNKEPGTTLQEEPEPWTSPRTTDPGPAPKPEPATSKNPASRPDFAARERSVTPALGLRGSNPIAIDGDSKGLLGRGVLVVRRSSPEGPADEQVITATNYAPRGSPFRVRVATDGAVVELTAPAKCVVARSSGENQELTGPTTLALGPRDAITIDHEGTTYSLRLQRGEPAPARSSVGLVIGVIAAAIVVAVAAGFGVYTFIVRTRPPAPPPIAILDAGAATAARAEVDAAIVPVAVVEDAAPATSSDASASSASDAAIAAADATIDAAESDASADAMTTADAQGTVELSLDGGVTPTLTIAQVVRLEGSLRRGVVVQGVGTVHPSILECWINAQARGTQPGDLGISFAVNWQGRARGVQRTTGSITDEAMIACVRDAFATARFGRPRGGHAEVVFAFGVR